MDAKLRKLLEEITPLYFLSVRRRKQLMQMWESV
jgi:hypothetical protein